MSKAYKTGFITVFIILAIVMVFMSIRSGSEALPGNGNSEVSGTKHKSAPPQNIPGVVLDDKPVSPVRTAAIRTDALSDIRNQEDSQPDEQSAVLESKPAKPASREEQLYELATSLGKVDTSTRKPQIRSKPLTVPQPQAKQEDTPPQKTTPDAEKQPPRSHTVEQGETLSSISRYYYGTPNRWKDIQMANNIKDPSKIHIGEKLIIP